MDPGREDARAVARIALTWIKRWQRAATLRRDDDDSKPAPAFFQPASGPSGWCARATIPMNAKTARAAT